MMWHYNYPLDFKGLSLLIMFSILQFSTKLRMDSAITYCVTQRNALQMFSVKRREKVGNARACGSQQRAAGVPQAIRNVLYVSASAQVPAACRQNCDAVPCSQGRLLHINDGANEPLKKWGGTFLQKLRGECINY